MLDDAYKQFTYFLIKLCNPYFCHMMRPIHTNCSIGIIYKDMAITYFQVSLINDAFDIECRGDADGAAVW